MMAIAFRISATTCCRFSGGKSRNVFTSSSYMKTSWIWNLLIGMTLVCFSAFADTNRPAPLIITTNQITAAPNFRVVNGQLYNTEKSQLWKSMTGDCLAVSTNGLLVQLFKIDRIYSRGSMSDNQAPGAYSSGPHGQRLRQERKTPLQQIVLVNYPEQLQPAVGQRLSFSAMRAGNTNAGDQVLECWDYGLRHVVSVITTNNPSKPRRSAQPRPIPQPRPQPRSGPSTVVW